MGKAKTVMIFIAWFILLLLAAALWAANGGETSPPAAGPQRVLGEAETSLEAEAAQEPAPEGMSGTDPPILAAGEAETPARPDSPQAQEPDDGAETVLKALAEVLYTYDTRKRPFYEGAAPYMTEEAYETLIPMPVEGDEEAPVQMASHLEEISCYYRETENGGLEALAEIWYSLSGMGGYRARQIVRFSLVWGKGWKVSECTVLDTMEE